jgi:GNAT superfamily N-acetyltransferase
VVCVVIRPIRPEDKPLLADGITRLSPESAFRRFLSPKPRFTAGELRYLTEVDGIDHIALVAVEDSGLIGVARMVRDPKDRHMAEVAITVCDDHQRRGIGTLLADRLAARARAAGIATVTATMAADNVAAHRLLAHIAAHLHVAHHGPVDELHGELAA